MNATPKIASHRKPILITNHGFRALYALADMPIADRAPFSYRNFSDLRMVRFKGKWIDVLDSQLMTFGAPIYVSGWNRYRFDGVHTGLCFKIRDDRVIIGRFFLPEGYTN